ncbi:MAG TPA: protein kinase, partial [Anaerolineae bacterium]|nr:protein kinase [Anaerolineae bacterium]
GFDQQFIERFQREARAAAGLRHPNIVVIHDVGQHDGTYFIVMEYLEGSTLKDLVEKEGPLHPTRSANIVEQLAAALDYAHQRGFVHRDIKPANIFVGEGDRVTLTDFGIAKAASETQQLTRTGTLMGTPEYMSPEQAEGENVDHRTDLYALGVVLYQMLSGQVPFRGTTPHAVLHDIIYESPAPPRQVNPNLSPALEAVILKAIAKRPEQRFQRGADMSKALRQALAGGRAGGVAVPPPVRPTPPRGGVPVPAPAARRAGSPLPWILAAIAAVLVLVSGALLLALRGGDREPVATPVATQVVAGQTGEATATEEIPPTSAPSELTAEPTTAPGLPADTPVPATDTALPPTDTPVPPTDTPAPPAALFGRLAFSSNRDGNPEIYVLDLASGSPRRLTNNSANDWLPDWSPDGSRLAFTSSRTGSYDLWVANADGSGQDILVATGAWDEYARWAPDGRRLSLSTTANTEGVPNSEIFVRQPDGSLVQVTRSTAENQWADWSPDGRLVYSEGFKGDSDWNIYIINPDGTNRALWLGEPTCDVQATWSPDGQWIAFLRIRSDTNGNGAIDFEDAGDVWVGRASGDGLRQLTSGMWATTPAWSPDNEWIAFARLIDSNSNGRSDGDDDADIMAVPFGGGEPETLIAGPSRDGDPSWTR